ncbi:hypothetical protein HWV62_43856 [Athelia sp. TMB]|nr:hypothetical protein HWV62_43856 [Athelia sp. TMB]
MSIWFRETNQTTLESLSPFLLLRYLPPFIPSTPSTPSSPSYLRPHQPQFYDENRMSSAQRRVVRQAHSQVFLYDVGWKRNWAQVIGWDKQHGHGMTRAGRKRLVGWAWRIICGGAG